MRLPELHGQSRYLGKTEPPESGSLEHPQSWHRFRGRIDREWPHPMPPAIAVVRSHQPQWRIGL